MTGITSPWCKWLSAKHRTIQHKEGKVSPKSGNAKIISDLRDSMCLAEGRQAGRKGLRNAHRKEAAGKPSALGLSFGNPARWFCFVMRVTRCSVNIDCGE